MDFDPTASSLGVRTCRIPTSHELAALYKDNDFSTFCEANGIPTGHSIPSLVADLAEAAWNARVWWHSEAHLEVERSAHRAALLRQARTALADDVAPLPMAAE